MSERCFVIRSAVSGTALSFDKLYSYRLPERFAASVKAGSRVLVPFGKGDSRRIALVFEVLTTDDDVSKLKSVSDIVDSEPLVDDEMLKIIGWLKENTFCTYFDAYRAVVPGGFSVSTVTHFEVANTELDESELSDEERELLLQLKRAPDQKTIDSLLGFSGGKVVNNDKRLRELVSALKDKGAVEEINSFRKGVGDATELNAALTEEYVNGCFAEKLSTKQKAVISLLEEAGSASVEELCYMAGCTRTVVNRLAEKGAVRLFKVEIMRKATEDAAERRSPDDIKLNSEQTAAFEGIMELVRTGRPSGALLYGVTGSGKTSVFFKLIKAVLDMGRSAMLLVPEISLTPQMVKKFKLYFGDEIALLHSSLSLGQRKDEFKRIKAGKARIVIGTRSAVFAPLKDIGIIIMDEEGERTYKSDSPPRYHARDVAIQRCGYHGAVLVMASATPSVESFYFAKQGRFHLFEMKHRYAGATLPTVEIIDMQNEALASNDSVFSRRLADAIEETLEKGEQVILLLNRRGFTTYVSCIECRKPVSCPNCSLPLTYHKKNGRLMCHYCGFSMAMPDKCPECGCTRLRQSGVGTQRIEDELAKLYPKARLLRMDADTTFTRGAYEESFNAFEKGEYDIMLGTQMIAKGLNFPNVTLVGVVSVDKALFTGDFRSYERTFSLITQVAGRSGRGDKPGTALIQTFVPDHYVINLAAQQDYDGFYEQESELRHALLFPPYCDICAVNFSSVMESRVIEGSRKFMQIFKDYIKEKEIKIPLRVLGPSPCTLERINNRYRYRLIIKCRLSRELREMVMTCLDRFRKLSKYAEVRVTADINGDIGL